MAQSIGALSGLSLNQGIGAIVGWVNRTRPRWHAVLPWLVLATAVISAGFLYASFRELAAYRWSSAAHDRNAHYLFGLRLANDVRNFDILRLARDFDAGGRVWYPLHGVLLSFVLLIGGPDHRLAVLPSLAGWVGTIVFGFLLARRIVPRYGNAAGLAAALFLLTSPAHRAYATDIMLESLGACLTLGALYAYVRWIREGGARGAVLFGFMLTLLFFNKSNYWLLVVFAAAASELARRHDAIWLFVRTTWREIPWREWLCNQPKRWLNWPLAGVLLFMATIKATGGFSIELAGKTVKCHTNQNVLTIAYALVLIRVIGWWRAGGAAWVKEKLGIAGYELVRWHGVPMAIWFLLPQRIHFFLWYLSTDQSGELPQQGGLLDGAQLYWQGILRDYHLTVAGTTLGFSLLALALVACVRRGAARSGLLAVGLYVVIAAFLLVKHPNQKYRFMHTLLPVVWVAAGAGFAILLVLLDRLRLAKWTPYLGMAGLVALGVTLASGFDQRGHASESGLSKLDGSWRDVTDAYLPYLDQSRHAAVLSNLPLKFMATWSYLERYRRAHTLEIDLREAGNYAPATEAGFRRWIEITKCDTLVYIAVQPGGLFFEPSPPSESNAEVGRLLPDQRVFQLVARLAFPQYGIVVTIWRK